MLRHTSQDGTERIFIDFGSVFSPSSISLSIHAASGISRNPYVVYIVAKSRRETFVHPQPEPVGPANVSSGI